MHVSNVGHHQTVMAKSETPKYQTHLRNHTLALITIEYGWVLLCMPTWRRSCLASPGMLNPEQTVSLISYGIWLSRHKYLHVILWRTRVRTCVIPVQSICLTREVIDIFLKRLHLQTLDHVAEQHVFWKSKFEQDASALVGSIFDHFEVLQQVW